MVWGPCWNDAKGTHISQLPSEKLIFEMACLQQDANMFGRLESTESVDMTSFKQIVSMGGGGMQATSAPKQSAPLLLGK
jgi:hypothetical protein